MQLLWLGLQVVILKKIENKILNHLFIMNRHQYIEDFDLHLSKQTSTMNISVRKSTCMGSQVLPESSLVLFTSHLRILRPRKYLCLCIFKLQKIPITLEWILRTILYCHRRKRYFYKMDIVSGSRK